MGGGVVYGLFFYDSGAFREQQAHLVSEIKEMIPGVPEGQVRSQVFLYFSDPDGNFLFSEERSLMHPEDPVGMGRQIVKAMIEGPKAGLMRTIPPEAALNAFFVTDDGVSYVDFNEAIRESHGWTQIPQ